MKCQILFSGINKKNVTNLSSELAQRVVKVRYNQRIKAQYLVIIWEYFFLFLHQNIICCGHSLEAPWQGASIECPQVTT